MVGSVALGTLHGSFGTGLEDKCEVHEASSASNDGSSETPSCHFVVDSRLSLVSRTSLV